MALINPHSEFRIPQSGESAARRRDVITAWRRNVVDSTLGRGKNMPPPRRRQNSRARRQLRLRRRSIGVIKSNIASEAGSGTADAAN